MGLMASLTKIILKALRVKNNSKKVLRHLFENNYILRMEKGTTTA